MRAAAGPEHAAQVPRERSDMYGDSDATLPPSLRRSASGPGWRPSASQGPKNASLSAGCQAALSVPAHSGSLPAWRAGDENDPNFPFFDEVHGVYHLMCLLLGTEASANPSIYPCVGPNWRHIVPARGRYQDHVCIAPGHGPDIGHVVSRDFVHWAHLPVSVSNSPFCICLMSEDQ